MADVNHRPPLVYSCSGCSSAAQMANALAIRLDREGAVPGIAGVGGGVPALVKTARSGRRILALDGCVLACARACLAREGLAPDEHVVLGDFRREETANTPTSTPPRPRLSTRTRYCRPRSAWPTPNCQESPATLREAASG